MPAAALHHAGVHAKQVGDGGEGGGSRRRGIQHMAGYDRMRGLGNLKGSKLHASSVSVSPLSSPPLQLEELEVLMKEDIQDEVRSWAGGRGGSEASGVRRAMLPGAH